MKFQILPVKERLLRNPKAFYIAALFLFSVIVTLLSVLLDPTRQYDPNRHQYDPETRIESPEYDINASQIYFTDEEIFSVDVLAADLIVEGKVVEVIDRTEEQLGVPGLSYTSIFVEPREIWYGECGDRIEVRMIGGIDSGPTKPMENDEVILFLLETSTENVCATVDFERSIFTINPPDNTIYAFSHRVTLAAFDGKSVNQFKQAVSQELRKFIANPDTFPHSIGKIANDRLSDGHPRKKVYETE